MIRSFLFFIFLFGNLISNESLNQYQISINKKPPQINWRAQVVQVYPSGTPHIVVYYEPQLDGERVVSQEIYYENNSIKSVFDLIELKEKSQGSIKEKSRLVPHGTKVDFFSNQKIENISNYKFGILEGDSILFFDNGQIKEFYQYKNGLIDGECITYYENGQKSASIPYINGNIDGKVETFFPNGILSSQKEYKEGLLNDKNMQPAFICYNEHGNITEVSHFLKGNANGFHLKYHANGTQSYSLKYKFGKKEGI
jgi:antitoxin component YwqK of YwqJK toxin-antitoxin module